MTAMSFGLLEWIVGSIALLAAMTNVRWALAHAHAPASRAPRWLVSREAAAVARGLYLFGIPVLAMALRIPGLHAGNLGIPTPESLDRGWRAIGLDAGTLVTAGLWSAAAVATIAAGRWWLARGATVRPMLALRAPAAKRIGTLALAALLWEVHWAFVRAGALSIGLDNRTAAVFLGLGLLGIEAWVDPATRAAIHDEDAMARRSLTAVLAVLSAIVFLATGSSLACLLGHLLAGAALIVISPSDTTSVGALDPAPPADAGGPDIGAIEPTVV